MGHPRYGTYEIAVRGREIYKSRLRQELEPDNVGKYLIIDIETGEFEIDDNGDAASLRASKKKPDGVRYAMRVGHQSLGRIGRRSSENK